MNIDASQPDLDSLRNNFRLAVTAWLNANFGDWQELWLGPEGALLKYALAKHCDFDADDLNVLSKLEQHDHRLSANELYQDADGETLNKEAEQAVQLMQGLVHGVLSAAEMRTWKPGKDKPSDDFVRHAGQCIAAYQQAWPLSDEVVKHVGRIDPFADPIANALNVLAGNPECSPYLTTATWLTVRRLWGYLLDAGDTKADFENKASVLLADDAGGGAVGPLAVQRSVEGQSGCYFDPVAFGQTLVDRSMIRSLQLAWNVCQPALQKHLGDYGGGKPALRLSPDLPGVVQISGGSAGGLVACALLATARSQRLDLRRTATVALMIENKDTPELVQLQPVGSIVAKLTEAQNLEHGLVAIGLHQQDHELWRKHHGHVSRPATVGFETLAGLLEFLRGDERYEDLLEQHCRNTVAEVIRLETGGGGSSAQWDEYDEYRLDRYVWPTYHIEQPIKDKSAHSDPAAAIESTPVDGEREQCLINLLTRLNSGKSLVIYDRAGAGKTVCSWQMRRWAASTEARERLFNLRTPLVVRFHGKWDQSGHNSKLSVEQALMQDELLRKIASDDEQRQACIRYALDQQRVVIILDGFDQFDDGERNQIAELLKPDTQNTDARAGCRWIITSRVHTIDAMRGTLFDSKRWTRVRIDPFSTAQQDEYFADTDGRWLETVPNREEMNDLLQLPLALRMIRRLIEETPDDQPLPVFHTLGELFLRVARRLLVRALTKSDAAVQEALKRADLDRLNLNADEQLTLLEQVLCLLGFQMLLDENYNGIIESEGPRLRQKINGYLQRAKGRFLFDIHQKLDDTKLKDWERDDLKDERRRLLKHWDWSISVLMTIELNHRAITESFHPEQIAFRSRKIVECYAARYLTKFATTFDVFGPDAIEVNDEPSAARFTNDVQWKACWQLAIEMPRAESDDTVTVRSLSALFRMPASGLRPSELMYQAWHLIEEDRFTPFKHRGQVLSGAGKVVQAFRKPFQDRVDQQHPIARQLVPQEDTEKMPAERKNFVRCPPSTADIDHAPFWRGLADETGFTAIAGPRRPVVVAPFRMKSKSVTWKEYSLYDPNHEIAHRQERDRSAPDDDCPVICVTWYDAMMFAKFIGGRLPTEAEWEYACRAGGKAKWFFGSDESLLSKYAWNVNETNGRAHPVAQLCPNTWGLYDMHGNVWEWCHDWFKSDYYGSLPTDKPAENPQGPATGSSRILRGGCWRHGFGVCGAATRHSAEPSSRFSNHGFRVVR